MKLQRMQMKLLASLVIVSLVLALLPAGAVGAVSPSIVISQVYGGGGNTGATYTHDFIELFNRGSAPASLAGWSLQYASATGTGNLGSSSTQLTELPSVVLEPGQYYLIQEAQGAGGSVVVPADFIDPTPIAISGTAGKVALVTGSDTLGCNGSSTACSADQLARIVDLIGWGNANFFEGAVAPATTNTTSVSRAEAGCADTDNNAADFTAGEPLPRNAATPLSPCGVVIEDQAPLVSATTPAEGAADVAETASLSVTFSEPVTITDPWFSLVCSTTGTKTAAVSGGPVSFTLDPDSDFVAGESCLLSIFAASVADQDANDPPDLMAADFTLNFSVADVCAALYTPIPTIQGSGATVAVTGTVTTVGIVVGDYEGPSPALRGFFIQDPTGDGDPATSDGIFVFNGANTNLVNLGDRVRVTGNAGENQGQSQVSVGTVVPCGTGAVIPTDVVFPVASADFLERYEGMLVRLPQTMYVTEHFQLGRFGQVVLSAGGRLQQPTHLVAPGVPALALQAENNLRKIILDDASQTQNPDPILFARDGQLLSAANTLRGGDTATGIVGVLNYTWAGNAASGNAYRVRPINALNGSINFEAANQRPTAAPEVGGTLRVVGMNTLNYFNTFDGLPDTVDNCTLGLGGGVTDCRGADTQAEFDRQWPKTVAAILKMNPDVLGVNEVENDGYGPDSALATLVSQLNAASAPGTYAFIDVDATTGQVNALGTDAIKVGMIYKPTAVTPVGATAALNSVEFVNGGDSAPRSRPSLAQAFRQNANGAVFVVDVNHFKSKGSACDAPDAGDGQGNCNTVRANSAAALAAWLAGDPTGTGTADVLIIGDLNSYAQEDPITALKAAGYTNLVETRLGTEAYSYVFDGQWGYLDYALGSAAILPAVTGVGEYHINADEPSVLDYNTDFKTANLQTVLYAPDEFRVSDHDPIMVGLDLNGVPLVEAGGPYAVDEGGSVELTATGSDPDGDALVFAWDVDNDGVFETPGQSATFSAAGLDGPGSQTVAVQVTDPAGETAVASAIVNVINVAPQVGALVVSSEPSFEKAKISVSAGFVDAGPDAPFTCTIDFGDGSPVVPGSVIGTNCVSLEHAYADAGQYTITVTVTDKDGGVGQNSAVHRVIYVFRGYYFPIVNPPAVNRVTAGLLLPVIFSLGGNQGSDIFAPGSPYTEQVNCTTGAVVPGTRETQSTLEQTLTYNRWTGLYAFGWKTSRNWAGTCRQLVVGLDDGTTHTALFRFIR